MSTRQHRLPAVYIGGFGSGQGKLRKRPVWVRNHLDNVYECTPEKLNADVGVYDLTEFEEPAAVDKIWPYYEGKLQQSIAALASGQTNHIAREAFLQGMIPFVAGLCVRSEEWDDWMTAGTASIADMIHPDNANFGRVSAFQRLAGAVMRCTWIVWHAPPGYPFITNDIGFTIGAYEDGQAFMFVPLKPDLGLELRRQVGRPPLWHKVPGGRMAVVGRYDARLEDMPTVNRYIAEDARREVYGKHREDVSTVDVTLQQPRNPRLPAKVVTEYSIDSQRPPDEDWLEELSHAGLDWPKLPMVTILDLLR